MKSEYAHFHAGSSVLIEELRVRRTACRSVSCDMQNVNVRTTLQLVMLDDIWCELKKKNILRV